MSSAIPVLSQNDSAQTLQPFVLLPFGQIEWLQNWYGASPLLRIHMYTSSIPPVYAHSFRCTHLCCSSCCRSGVAPWIALSQGPRWSTDNALLVRPCTLSCGYRGLRCRLRGRSQSPARPIEPVLRLLAAEITHYNRRVKLKLESRVGCGERFEEQRMEERRNAEVSLAVVGKRKTVAVHAASRDVICQGSGSWITGGQDRRMSQFEEKTLSNGLRVAVMACGCEI